MQFQFVFLNEISAEVTVLPSPIINLNGSMADAKRLLEIHSDIGGTDKGRRWGIDILNKSAVVFVAAAWEAFVEDVATQAIDHIIAEAEEHHTVPLLVRKAVAKGLETHSNELEVWRLAGNGWRNVVLRYRDDVIRDEISTFNTPKPHNVNALFKKLIGIENISTNWSWPGMSHTSACTKLRKFIETRGAIAHRGELPQTVTKAYVERHRTFVNRLAVRTSNVVREEIRATVGTFPWPRARFGTFT